jgi:hypothetical protein
MYFSHETRDYQDIIWYYILWHNQFLRVRIRSIPQGLHFALLLFLLTALNQTYLYTKYRGRNDTGRNNSGAKY